jgi:hypothetical protein
MRKIARILIVLSGLFLCSACQADQPSTDIRGEIPSRYDLITVEKVLPGQDNHSPIIHSEEWKTPYPISGSVNSAGLEDSPFITPDGHTLFFFYTPSADTLAKQQINDQVTGIYRSKKVSSSWQEPERMLLAQGSDLALDSCPFFQDNVLWFCSIRAGNFRDIDIWTAAWDGTHWTDIINAGTYLNQDLQIGKMLLSPDWSALICHRSDKDHSNKHDLWEVPRGREG